jgi:hypothetical protein
MVSRRLVFFAVLAVGLVSVAPESRAEKGYGAAGCGLGAMIFGSEQGAVQLLAGTTNGLFFNQSFGITSGTLNCGPGMLGSSDTKKFVEANREALAKDISRGSGETIASLSKIAGCADPKAVGATLQKSFKTIFPSASVTSEVVSESILSTLRAEKSLACVAIG